MESRPFTAPLDNPLYYLANFRTVLAWVGTHHADLLTDDERARLAGFEALPRSAQALLVRMVMRSGCLFRLSKLRYPELGAPVTEVLEALEADGWIDPRPALSLEELFGLLTRPELGQALADDIARVGLKRSATKQALLAALSEQAMKPRSLTAWWPESDDRVVALTCMPLFERVRLLFFGNLRQDWSEFVLTELGHQRYEPVPFSAASRAFQVRGEVDSYLHLHACRERLEADETPGAIWQDLPREKAPNPWLESRRGRVLYALGCQAERLGDPVLALAAWSASTHREARLRRLRLMERRGEHAQAFPQVEAALAAPRCGAERQGLERLRARLAKRLGESLPARQRAADIPTVALTLPPLAEESVESAVAAHLSRADAPVHYVENRLFNALLALLCWPALYAPLPGAFFHPFHAAPADLDREDFVARRRRLFNDCLAALTTDDYRRRIVATWQEKAGITNPFVHWPTVTLELIELALACIPAAHLAAVFERMLADLRDHRSGLPDLIQFAPPGYRLIEVKAPGDRLQDHQRRWLAYCQAHGIEVAVCQVSWEEPA